MHCGNALRKKIPKIKNLLNEMSFSCNRLRNSACKVNTTCTKKGDQSIMKKYSL